MSKLSAEGREWTGLSYPDGRNVTYTYDEAIRLSSLNDGNGTITYGYDEAGRLSRAGWRHPTHTIWRGVFVICTAAAHMVVYVFMFGGVFFGDRAHS